MTSVVNSDKISFISIFPSFYCPWTPKESPQCAVTVRHPTFIYTHQHELRLGLIPIFRLLAPTLQVHPYHFTLRRDISRVNSILWALVDYLRMTPSSWSSHRQRLPEFPGVINYVENSVSPCELSLYNLTS